ncbi:MAG TPA: hypothetical protein VE690_13435 [Rhodopila sp.]|nr:hypothetical protein [Rhodopila sp.]
MHVTPTTGPAKDRPLPVVDISRGGVCAACEWEAAAGTGARLILAAGWPAIQARVVRAGGGRLVLAFSQAPDDLRVTVQHQGGGTVRVTDGEVGGNGGADGNAGERHLAGDAGDVEQGGEVIGHLVPGDRAPDLFRQDLFRQAGAARVVAQHAAGVVQRGQRTVPTVQRAAHLMHQDQGCRAAAGVLMPQAGRVDFGPFHGERPSPIDLLRRSLGCLVLSRKACA